ncbi:hypothetical protein BDZ97DRAFT_1922565 [Flammula alnicola]|nr:hypothetical protein BDZ97DRAFT_1922565 [Flammula alnicola]
MHFSPYFPHVLYSVALTSISINLVSQRKKAEDEKSRVQAQISILESIKQQLQSNKPLSTDELERLKKLARASAGDAELAAAPKEEITWGDIFGGKKPVVAEDEEVSKWDKQDLESLRKEMSK